MTPHPVEGQWLDFYALLDVPVNADEDTIRKRIGKVYAEAASNSDHRDLARRHYFQTLVERVLPQCRRVLLDPEWRAKYDRQHILHSISDPSSQDYVTFFGSMRSKDVAEGDLAMLPQRIEEDLQVAREVVACARQGAELDLLPSTAISGKETLFPTPSRDAKRAVATLPSQNSTSIGGRILPPNAPQPALAPALETVSSKAPRAASSVVAAESSVPALQATVHLSDGALQAPAATKVAPRAASAASAAAAPKAKPPAEIIAPPTESKAESNAEPVRAQVITAQEAAEIRRRRTSNPDTNNFIKPTPAVGDGSVVIPRRKSWKAPVSRVIVEEPAPKARPSRLISPTSMNLMVAIVGVLLTITIQKFASTPAIATNVGRTPIFVAVASEMESALLRAEAGWEKTPEGANFDLIVQSVDSRTGLRRALGTSGPMPDVWIPSDSLWADLYNAQAPKLKRQTLSSDQPVAHTPMVLIARSERAAPLRQRFPDHLIDSWNALRGAIISGAPGRLGLTDPQKAATGAQARYSMAREWAATQNQSPSQAAKNPKFWNWMAAFEDNAPASPAQTGAMVKDLVLGTTGRYWWGIAYESQALEWMNEGKSLEIFYLPRTTLADHPFCPIERIGAPLEVAQARASFEKYLRGPAMQKQLLDSGFRPTELALQTKTPANPFLKAEFRTKGARLENLPRDERRNPRAMEILVSEWGRRFN
jgi:hypothetical protein